MFTIIICDESVKNDCFNKYHIYLKSLLDSENIAFCVWNTQGTSLDEALPDIKQLIRNKKEWRAIIINDRYTWDCKAIEKRNPFDYADCQKFPTDILNAEQIKKFRENSVRETETALTNPLMRLSAWLCGSPMQNRPAVDYLSELPDIDSVEEEAYFERLKESRLSAAEVEIDRARLLRYESLSVNFGQGSELFNPPASVIAVAERSKDASEEEAESHWKKHTEFDYSKFYDGNLYSPKLRYLLYDMPCINGVRNENSYFNFLTVLLILATNECPNDALRPDRVYSIDAHIDPLKVNELCNRYNAKLKATLRKIGSISGWLAEKAAMPIDRETAETVFESDISIPVKIDSYFDTNDLKAKYDKIGLSRDCPQDEYQYWDDQYHKINKLFIRYLREPRRAVKNAVKNDVRANSRIVDDRALQMDENQREDVEFRLLEEEQSMVETVTTQLFNSAEYKKQMDEADKELKRGIGQRMTKKKTVFVGLAAALVYLIGFLPMIFSNINTAESFLFSLTLTGITLGIFLIIGFIFLFVLRHRLINRFKHFNYVMSGICKKIERGLKDFSIYLSRAYNVMREFSVLAYTGNPATDKRQILKKHEHDIIQKIDEVNALFAGYVDSGCVEDYDIKPYNYDFTVMADYTYEMPFFDTGRDIDFMQQGHTVTVPVDYVESITLTREELYD